MDKNASIPLCMELGSQAFGSILDDDDISGLQPFLGFNQHEANGLSRLQGSGPLTMDFVPVHKDIGRFFVLDESIAEFSGKPLHNSNADAVRGVSS